VDSLTQRLGKPRSQSQLHVSSGRSGFVCGTTYSHPRTDYDLYPAAHIQAIANTAAFHFATIEQGGTTLYLSMAQRASSVEVLRILISIGPVETAHFQTWHDKAGNAVSPAFNVTDPTNGLMFPNLSNAGQLLRPT
jgi:hypothetical protein